ncbi:MAG: hypothetical protein M1828_003503 [Chrysothrix sp. TS-e1954]|nr:MAG: hypothetical protein M1828_003503 [Chrysothrix sp. TS-e1954]
MQRICKVGLDTVRNRVRPQSIESRLSRCVDLRAEIEDTQKQAAEHLRKIELCRNAQQKTEHWTMHLHASYMLSELCRPAISPSISVFDKDKKLRAQCIIHLMNTVEAFIGLASVSPTHTRSWPISHRALSSALLLGILGESTRNSRAQEILAKLSSLVREIAAITDGGQLSAPVQRSLSALHKLSAPESRTPRVMEDSNSVAVQQQQYSQPPGQQLLKQQQLDQQMQPVIKTEASPPTASALNGTLAPPHSLSAFNAVAPAPSNVVNGMGSTDMDGIPTSNNVNGMTSVTDASDMTDNEPFPSLDFSDSSYFLPSPLSGFEDESSPYALMDSIMWGGGRA